MTTKFTSAKLQAVDVSCRFTPSMTSVPVVAVPLAVLAFTTGNVPEPETVSVLPPSASTEAA